MKKRFGNFLSELSLPGWSLLLGICCEGAAIVYDFTGNKEGLATTAGGAVVGIFLIALGIYFGFVRR